MARKSRKQTAAPMPAPSLYVHVALYIRLSVEDNKKRGCSVENQKLVLNDFLSDKPDFVVYDTYIDNGATGTNFHRPGFQQMLSDIEAGHINCVIVKDLSRLGRNSIDTGYYIEQYFHAHNVRFIAVTDQFDTEDSGNLHGGIMLPLKNMINEAYALDIGRKIKAQARQAMKDGDYIGARAPYGYRKDPDNCHKLLIDENTAPVVKQIFEWAHEHVSLNRIVRNLNEMGIPAPSHYKKDTGEITSPGLIGSGKWQTRTVMKILESEVYTGDLVQGKTKIVMALNAKQKQFYKEYVVDANATQSAIRAGYSKKTAYSQGQRLLKNVEGKKYLAELMAEKDSKLIADQDEVLKYLTSVLRGKSQSTEIVVEGVGDGCSEAREIKKAPSEKERLKAAELLGKRYGIYTDKVDAEVDMELNINIDYGEDNA